MRRRAFFVIVFLTISLLVACQNQPEAVSTTAPVADNETIPPPTPTNLPTATPQPEPTVTNTVAPTPTSIPTATMTPSPTLTPTPSAEMLENAPYYLPQTSGLTVLVPDEAAGFHVVPNGCNLVRSDGSEPLFPAEFEVNEAQLRQGTMGESIQLEVSTEIYEQLQAIQIRIVNFTLPPAEADVAAIEIYDIPGWQEPPHTTLIFPETTLMPSVTEVELTIPGEESILQPGGGAGQDSGIIFLMPIWFAEAGQYELQFRLIGETIDDETPLWDSLPITYGWLEMENVSTSQLVSAFFPDVELTWSGSCP